MIFEVIEKNTPTSILILSLTLNFDKQIIETLKLKTQIIHNKNLQIFRDP